MFIINVHKINTFNSLILFTSVQLVLFQQIKSLVSKKIHRNQNLQKIQPKSTEVCFVPWLQDQIKWMKLNWQQSTIDKATRAIGICLYGIPIEY